MGRVLGVVAAAALAWGCTSGAAQPAAAEPATGPRVLGSFEGVLDPATGALSLRAPGGGAAANQLTLVDGAVTIQTVGGTSSAGNCAGNSFEGAVRITNNSAGTLSNVYAQIYEMSLAGREACNGDPDNGSATSTADGFWNYGDLAPAASATRTWRLQHPDTTSYTFRGHVLTVTSPGPSAAASGNGKGWVGQIQNLYLDSGSGSLRVGVKMNPIDGTTNNLWILVDDTAQATGPTDLTTANPTGWGVLGLVSTGGAAGASFEFAWSGYRGNLIGNRSGRQWTSPTTFQDVTGAVSVTQDNVAGYYSIAIPYGSIGNGAIAADTVRVWALWGLNSGSGGIHSAAPEQGPAQLALMNGTTSNPGDGLAQLDVAGAPHVLK